MCPRLIVFSSVTRWCWWIWFRHFVDLASGIVMLRGDHQTDACTDIRGGLKTPEGEFPANPASQREVARCLRSEFRAAQLRVFRDEERGRLTPHAVKSLAQGKLPKLGQYSGVLLTGLSQY
jgi:hypothetical protein